jgi:histidine ammonia-lyase
MQIDGRSLDLASFRRAVIEREPCELTSEAIERIGRARAVIEDLLSRGGAHYGINTGFGNLSRVRIDEGDTSTLQQRLLVSHAAGVGEPLPAEVVRGMLLLRANTLARGHSGVRPAIVLRLLDLLNADLLPVVPSRGSVGASGDLAPLAHLALPLIGLGRLAVGGRVEESAGALRAAGLEPLALEAKEGLALINGTQAMTSLLALAVLESRRLARIADLVGALSADALRGADTAFDPRLHELRPHPGQIASAANLHGLLRGSVIRESHREHDVRVQDPYCLRCMPQVHGAARDLLEEVAAKVEIEMNAVTDNPLVFPDSGEVLSGGNFHGEPMALAADVLAMAVAELGSISERRVDKLTDSSFSELPPFLVRESGLNSGFMIAQVTAAALVSENKTLAHSAAIDSIPTSAGQEDHVSMGMWAALKLRRVVENVRTILAIELTAAAQGIDLLAPLTTSEPLARLHAAFRQRVAFWDRDREMWADLEAAQGFLDGGIDAHLADLP